LGETSPLILIISENWQSIILQFFPSKPHNIAVYWTPLAAAVVEFAKAEALLHQISSCLIIKLYRRLHFVAVPLVFKILIWSILLVPSKALNRFINSWGVHCLIVYMMGFRWLLHNFCEGLLLLIVTNKLLGLWIVVSILIDSTLNHFLDMLGYNLDTLKLYEQFVLCTLMKELEEHCAFYCFTAPVKWVFFVKADEHVSGAWIVVSFIDFKELFECFCVKIGWHPKVLLVLSVLVVSLLVCLLSDLNLFCLNWSNWFSFATLKASRVHAMECSSLACTWFSEMCKAWTLIVAYSGVSALISSSVVHHVALGLQQSIVWSRCQQEIVKLARDANILIVVHYNNSKYNYFKL